MCSKVMLNTCCDMQMSCSIRSTYSQKKNCSPNHLGTTYLRNYHKLIDKPLSLCNMDEKKYSSGFRGISTLRSRQLLPGGDWQIDPRIARHFSQCFSCKGIYTCIIVSHFRFPFPWPWQKNARATRWKTQ